MRPGHLIAAALAVAVLADAGAAAAQSVQTSSRNRTGLSAQKLRVLDGALADRYRAAGRSRTPDAPVVRGGGHSGPWVPVAREAARRHRVPEDLFLALVRQESRWNPSARSHKGALGLAQLMPQTALRLGVDPMDPRQNLEGGARYLRAQFDRFGDWRLALAAYNAGPHAVLKYDGVPPYRETEGYVVAILGN